MTDAREIGGDEREEEHAIGGHVTAPLGRLPRKGDTVRVGRYEATVSEVSRRRVQRLQLRLVGPESPGTARVVEEGQPA